ncbi:MAG: glycoside hydrolase family protein [Lentisphaeria bacterium]|nr:glycoside hydrolase family protein [Lentisphaeria bacterium]
MPNPLASVLQPVPETAVFQDIDWYIWGGSMTRGPEGKYYLLYARWPRRFGHGGWLTHSEVAVAVAGSPRGPFRHLDIVLPARGEGYFDAWCTHNPTVHCFDGTWYLYYMGTSGPREWIDTHLDGGAVPQEIRICYQAAQRIGVATAPHPAGPWTRRDAPLIDRGEEGMPDERMVSNPAVCRRPDGSYLMIYKCSEGRDPLQKQGRVVHLAATADNPDGPFIKTCRCHLDKGSLSAQIL